MSNLDLIILIPIALGFVFGLFKGLIKELASLLAILLGIWGAKTFASSLSGFLIHSAGFSPKTALPFAYLILFASIAIILLIIAKTLDRFFESIKLGGLNKFLGGVFAALKYALIVSVLLNVFDAIDQRFPIIKPKSKTESFGYQPVKSLAPVLWEESKKRNVFDLNGNSSSQRNENENHR